MNHQRKARAHGIKIDEEGFHNIPMDDIPIDDIPIDDIPMGDMDDMPVKTPDQLCKNRIKCILCHVLYYYMVSMIILLKIFKYDIIYSCLSQLMDEGKHLAVGIVMLDWFLNVVFFVCDWMKKCYKKKAEMRQRKKKL